MYNKTILKVVGLLIGLSSVLSCNEEQNRNGWEKKVNNIDNMFEAFEKEIDLKSEIFIDDTVNLLRPYMLKIVKDYMIIKDSDEDKHYSIFDMQTKTIIRRFIGKGRGTNEYLDPYLDIFGEDTVMIIDNLKQKVAFFSLENMIQGNNIPDRIIHLKRKNNGDAINRCFFFNNLILTTGQFKEGRFYIFDANGDLRSYFGSYPDVSSSVNYDNYHLGYIYGGSEDIQSKLNLNKIACTHPTSLTIFDYSNNDESFNQSFFLQWQIDKIKDATYKDGKPYVVRIGNGTKIGAGSLAVNNKFLFFPFSKYEYEELYTNGVQDYYGYIFVINWEGKPILRLKLDKRIKFPLEIDKSGNYLFSIHTDTETGFPQILKFDISFLKNL